MGDFIALCVIVLVGLSPLLRRFYIDRFWIHARGTVIRVEVEGVINDEGGGWVWTPIIEYQAAGQQFSVKASGMAITGTVTEPRQLSSFGASSNRYADVPLRN